MIQIEFVEGSLRRRSGQWLLDAVVAERDEKGIVRRINIAMECESSTALQAFSCDFGKLLHVRSATKLYLQGLNPFYPWATDAFVTRTLQRASDLVRAVDPYTAWFFGFWPSPKRSPGSRRYGTPSLPVSMVIYVRHDCSGSRGCLLRACTIYPETPGSPALRGAWPGTSEDAETGPA